MSAISRSGIEPSAERLRESAWAAEPVGRFHTWWRGDSLDWLPHLPGLSIASTADSRVLARLERADTREMEARISRGHHPWLADVSGEIVGWGWCATEEATIGELGISFQIPPGNRYLWDFVTTPSWRGRGIYPRLLQSIVAHDRETERFWLGHDLINTASARGIAKSGFHAVGELYRQRDGPFTLVPTGPVSRATAASALFGLPVAEPLFELTEI